MSETVIFSIFFLGIFISITIYVVRFLKTPNLFRTIFRAYLAFLERDTFPKVNKKDTVKNKRVVDWKVSNKNSCLEYEKFKEKFPDEEYPYF